MTDNIKLDTNIVWAPSLTGLAEALSQILTDLSPTKVLVVTDVGSHKHCYPMLQQLLPTHDLVILQGGEHHKDMEALGDILNALANLKADRHSVVVNLGGGMVGDVGGMAAAMYMRGIQFLNLPTTLLAMVDASVGGKTGVNFNGIKNLVGSFRLPTMVLISPIWLTTLPEREIKAGLAEMLKHGLIADPVGFSELAFSIQALIIPRRPLNELDYDYWIPHSVKIKAAIVAEDFEEIGPRKQLNLGHTVAHALEAAAQKMPQADILHGEAVALGIWVEAILAYHMLTLQRQELESIEHICLALVPDRQLEVLTKAHSDDLIMTMLMDKKNKDGQIRAVLLRKIGETLIDRPVTIPEMEWAISKAQERANLVLQNRS